MKMPALAIALALATPVAAGEPAGTNGATNGAANDRAEEALLALEEAELRERMVTALAIAESLRMRGRTILVAMSEIARVRRSIEKLDPYSERRQRLEERLSVQERRREELEDEVAAMFEEYLVLVGEMATELWPRLRRVSGQLGEDLAERQLGQLSAIYPVMREHIEEFNRTGSEGLTPGITHRWRAEIDDTWDRRQEHRLRQEAAPAPAPRAPREAAPQSPEPKDRKEDI